MKSQNEEALDEVIEHIIKEYEVHYRALGELIVTAFEPYKDIIDRIQKRLKDIDSIKRKMERKGIGLEQIRHQIRDIIGIRIIIHFLSDIPVVLRKLRTLTELDIGTEQEIEDYIAKPQARGYRSLHINALYRKTIPACFKFPIKLVYRKPLASVNEVNHKTLRRWCTHILLQTS